MNTHPRTIEPAAPVELKFRADRYVTTYRFEDLRLKHKGFTLDGYHDGHAELFEEDDDGFFIGLIILDVEMDGKQTSIELRPRIGGSSLEDHLFRMIEADLMADPQVEEKFHEERAGR